MVVRPAGVAEDTVLSNRVAHLTYDVVVQVACHKDQIFHAAQDAKTLGRSWFETYLSRRINVGVSGDWLDLWS